MQHVIDCVLDYRDIKVAHAVRLQPLASSLRLSQSRVHWLLLVLDLASDLNQLDVVKHCRVGFILELKCLYSSHDLVAFPVVRSRASDLLVEVGIQYWCRPSADWILGWRSYLSIPHALDAVRS